MAEKESHCKSEIHVKKFLEEAESARLREVEALGQLEENQEDEKKPKVEEEEVDGRFNDDQFDYEAEETAKEETET